MTQNEKPAYNGWTNYETWAVNLWLMNEEPSYTYWCERTREVLANSDDIADLGEATGKLAAELREVIEEECSIEGASLAADLMGAALCEVNWHEIARSFVEDFAPSHTQKVEQLETEIVECVYCGKEISVNDAISTFCGSVHNECLPRHLEDCEICRADEGLTSSREVN
jgi:hypothetical protein